jgi:hypothetical protein
VFYGDEMDEMRMRMRMNEGGGGEWMRGYGNIGMLCSISICFLAMQ